MTSREIAKDKRRLGRNRFERKVIDGDPNESKHGDAHLCGPRSFASLGALSRPCFFLSAKSAARSSTFSTDARYVSASVSAPSAVAVSRRNDSSLDVSEMWPGGDSAALAPRPGSLLWLGNRPGCSAWRCWTAASSRVPLLHAVRTSCW